MYAVLRVALPVLLSLALAPVQCAKKPDPSRAREETAGDALYALAHDFEARGEKPAARATLEFLVKRYPSSRFAAAAKDELGLPADGASAPR